MASKHEFQMKRVYDSAGEGDGYRILVDRLWPRGLSKDKAKVDLWLKDIAPSDSLRIWFGHDPRKWLGFVKKYFQELDRNQGPVNALREIIREHEKVTILYAAADNEHNNAVALVQYMADKKRMGAEPELIEYNL